MAMAEEAKAGLNVHVKRGRANNCFLTGQGNPTFEIRGNGKKGGASGGMADAKDLKSFG